MQLTASQLYVLSAYDLRTGLQPIRVQLETVLSGTGTTGQTALLGVGGTPNVVPPNRVWCLEHWSINAAIAAPGTENLQTVQIALRQSGGVGDIRTIWTAERTSGTGLGQQLTFSNAGSPIWLFDNEFLQFRFQKSGVVDNCSVRFVASGWSVPRGNVQS